MYTEKLFSYGTLRYEEVQRQTFNRLLDGTEDKLQGYKTEKLRITDPDVLKASGEEFHNILVYTGNAQDEVDGVVFNISQQELAQADSYEVSDYKRVSAKLASGVTAWVYVKK